MNFLCNPFVKFVVLEKGALWYFILKTYIYCRAREEKLKKEIEDASAAKVPLVQ